MRKENGEIYVVFIVLMLLVVIGSAVFSIGIEIYSRVEGNKTVIDMNYTFTKAITYIGNEKIELKIKNWIDYEGEQIQIVTEDGKVYLLSTYNTILVNE